MINLLIIDNEPEILDMVMAQLALTGRHYEISAVSQVDAVPDAVKELGGVDILLTDYGMPGKNGIELSQELRLQFPNMATIIFSGHRREEIEKLACTDHLFLAKPFGVDAFAQVLREAEERVGDHKILRWEPPQLEEEGFSGLMTQLRLFDVVQALLLSHQVGRLIIRSGGQSGWIQLTCGKVTGAWCGGLEGEAAVHALFAWKSGSFSFIHNASSEAGGTILERWESLVMKALIDQDETSAVLEFEHG